MCIVLNVYLDRVIFETDATLVAVVVLNRSTTIFYLKSLLEEVSNLLNLSDWVVTIKHCFREVNSFVDLLAKKNLILLSFQF
jgi:polyphosphate kinase 2 (PPK2 family)